MLNSILNGTINWRTTIAGVLTFVAMITKSFFDFEISGADQEIILGFGLLVISWFAKDASKTGVEYK